MDGAGGHVDPLMFTAQFNLQQIPRDIRDVPGTACGLVLYRPERAALAWCVLCKHLYSAFVIAEPSPPHAPHPKCDSRRKCHPVSRRVVIQARRLKFRTTELNPNEAASHSCTVHHQSYSLQCMPASRVLACNVPGHVPALLGSARRSDLPSVYSLPYPQLSRFRRGRAGEYTSPLLSPHPALPSAHELK